MSEPTGPEPGSRPGQPPEQRIGDADRDNAVGFLREHHALGRIDAAEFEQRMSSALLARTASDLTELFTDLPDPRPPTGTGSRSPATFQAPPWQVAATPHRAPAPVPRPAPPVPERPWQSTVLTVVSAAAWPATLIFLFATGWTYWWLIFIPIFITSLSAKHRRPGR